MSGATRAPYEGGRAVMLVALGAGVGGAVFTAVGFALAPATALFSYLIAVIFFMTLAVGLMGFLLIVHTMNATWPTVVRRLAESGAAVMPLLAVLFVPILLGLPRLYPWVRISPAVAESARRVIEHKRAYLNVPFFILRSAGYLVLWSVLAWLLRRWSLATDSGNRSASIHRLRTVSAVLAPAMALTITAAGTDWIMSLTPEWVSYIFGFYLIALSILGGVAVLTLATAAADGRGPLAGINGSHYYALGRCLLSFLILWAYMAFFQFFIIWMANKPTEARWFIDREVGPFRAVSLFIIFGHFGFPFLALLSYHLKWRRSLLAVIAAWLLGAQYIEVHWLIAPQRGGAAFRWLDAAALIAVGGLSLAFGLWLQRGHPLAPVADPRFEAALRYDSR
jgi:hypothetical protein